MTQGYRITLTYNLYCMDRLEASAAHHLPAHDLTLNPLHRELRAALSNPRFLPKGAVLGFHCRHVYPYKDLKDTANLTVLLKGADRIVFSIAKSIGLSVMVKPVVAGDYDDFLLSSIPYYFQVGDMSEEYCQRSQGDWLGDFFGANHFKVKYIIWCGGKTRLSEPAGAVLTYGNSYSVDVFYKSVAILVGFPQWGEYRRACASGVAQRENSEDSPLSKDDSTAILETLCYHDDEDDDEDGDDEVEDDDEAVIERVKELLEKVCYHDDEDEDEVEDEDT